jgi:hypothetical protein
MKHREPHEGGGQSAICPDCNGSGRQGATQCEACGGVGRLYRLATPCGGEAWLSAAMLADALGKDPLDAAVIAAITDSAVLGVFFADNEGSQSVGPAEHNASATDVPECDSASPDDARGISSADDSESSDSD